MGANTCPSCRHSYRSRFHAVHCGHKSLGQWHASKIGHNVRQGTIKRTASEILASQRERPEFPHGEFDNGNHWRQVSEEDYVEVSA